MCDMSRQDTHTNVRGVPPNEEGGRRGRDDFVLVRSLTFRGFGATFVATLGEQETALRVNWHSNGPRTSECDISGNVGSPW